MLTGDAGTPDVQSSQFDPSSIDVLIEFLIDSGLPNDILESVETDLGSLEGVDLPDLPTGLVWFADSTDGFFLDYHVDVDAAGGEIDVTLVDGQLSIRRRTGEAIPTAGNTVTVQARPTHRFYSDSVWEVDGTDLDRGDLVQLAVSNDAMLRIRGAGWTNFVEPLDVNGSSDVSALDALQIINELNAKRFMEAGSDQLVDPRLVDVFPDRFFDVNADGRVSAVDALRIINHLNSRDRPASGEPTADPAASDGATPQLAIGEISSRPMERLVVAGPTAIESTIPWSSSHVDAAFHQWRDDELRRPLI